MRPQPEDVTFDREQKLYRARMAASDYKQLLADGFVASSGMVDPPPDPSYDWWADPIEAKAQDDGLLVERRWYHHLSWAWGLLILRRADGQTFPFPPEAAKEQAEWLKGVEADLGEKLRRARHCSGIANAPP